MPSAHFKKRARAHARGKPVKKKTRKTDWLMAQGYRLSRLPFKLTWYWVDKNSGQVNELRIVANDYNLNLYRGKGYVLDRKFLDPQAWHELEYGVKLPVVDAEPPKHPGRTPSLAKALKEALGKAYFWQGTPTELLALIDAGKQGIPKDAIGLSMQIMKPHITDALESYGIEIARHRSNGQRLLRLTCVANATKEQYLADTKFFNY